MELSNIFVDVFFIIIVGHSKSILYCCFAPPFHTQLVVYSILFIFCHSDWILSFIFNLLVFFFNFDLFISLENVKKKNTFRNKIEWHSNKSRIQKQKPQKYGSFILYVREVNLGSEKALVSPICKHHLVNHIFCNRIS